MDLRCFAGSLVQNSICRQPLSVGCFFVLDDDANAVVHKDTNFAEANNDERVAPSAHRQGTALGFSLVCKRVCVVLLKGYR